MAETTNLFLNYENSVLSRDQMTRILPITVVTGFLGAGKTTLLKNIYKAKLNLRIVCTVNDFAKLNIDHAALKKCAATAASLSPSPFPLPHPIVRDTEPKHEERETERGDVVGISDGCVCCSKLEAFKATVWDFLSSDELVTENIDFFILETSGVSEPVSLIETLGQRFGKMTRARLDAIIAVIDSDYLLSRLDEEERRRNSMEEREEGEEQGKTEKERNEQLLTMIEQMKNADVVLLNKRDLVPEERREALLEKVKGWCREGARIYETEYCQLPLPCLLEVDVAETCSEVVCHEKGLSQAFIPKNRGVRLGEKKKAGEKRTYGRREEHIVSSRVSSVTFQSTSGLSLPRFQRWLRSEALNTIIRMKGYLYFQEDSSERYEFHLSGNKRMELAPDGRWLGPPSVQLVIIGQALDEQALQEQLMACCQESEVPSSAISIASRVLASDHAEKRVLRLRSVSGGGGLGELELVFPAHGSLTHEELRMSHGINFKSLTSQFISRVHLSGSGFLLLPHCKDEQVGRGSTVRESEEAHLCLRFAMTDEEEQYLVYMHEATEIVNRYLKGLSLCRCGA